MRAGLCRLTRQVVSRTGTGGCNLCHGDLLAALGAHHRARTRAIRPHVGAVPCLRKKLRVHQGTQQGIADVAFKAPEPLGLRRCQSKSGHFYILTLDPLKHVVDTHRPPLGNRTELAIFFLADKGREQLVYRIRGTPLHQSIKCGKLLSVKWL